MNSKLTKISPKWVVKFTYNEPITNFLIDLKGSEIFHQQYPVFKLQLARELMASKLGQFFHVEREKFSVEIRDPTGKEVPLASCLFILATSTELGVFKTLFFPQTGERLVLTALDEVWIKVLENVQEDQRLTLITNVAASLLTRPQSWSQIYLVY